MSVVADPPTAAGSQSADRSAVSLAMVLVRAAERLRTDPAENIGHCAVRGAAEVLRARLDQMDQRWEAARDAPDGP